MIRRKPLRRNTKPLKRTRISPRAKSPGRRSRNAREGHVKAVVRAECVARDGYCRAQGHGVGECDGPSEWAHFHSHRRSKTLGQEPEERHTKQGSLMLCKRHHQMYDGQVLGTQAERLAIDVADEARGADGPLRFRRGIDLKL